MQETWPNLHLIFLEEALLLSKYPYDGWRQIQNTYPTYKASLGPMTVDDVIIFFQDDYGDNDEQWPFSRRTIQDFLLSESVTIATD